MSRRNIIFTFFLLHLIRWAPNVRAPRCLVADDAISVPGVNMGFTFSDDDRILAVT